MTTTPAIQKITTPNGVELNISQFTATDIEEIDNWIKSQYLERAAVATKHLPATQQNLFLQGALNNAMKLTFQFGDGRQMIFSNIYGITRLTYQAIRSPKMTFTEYHTLLFPNDILNDEGVNFLIQFYTQLEGDTTPSPISLTHAFINDLSAILTDSDSTDEDVRNKVVDTTLQFFRTFPQLQPH